MWFSTVGDFGGKRKLLDTAANTNSDLIAQAMNAAHDAVTRAVSGTSDAQTAASKNMAYSKLTTKLSARPCKVANHGRHDDMFMMQIAA